MSLSNLYEETDKTNRRRWMFAGLAVLVLNSYILAFAFCGRDMSSEAVEKRIANSETFRRVDNMCSKILKPQGSKFLYKRDGGNSFTASVTHEYQIPNRSKNEVYQFYQKLFSEKGWTYNDGRYESMDGKQIISIHYTDAYNLIYTFYCAEIYG